MDMIWLMVAVAFFSVCLLVVRLLTSLQSED
jgi:hypothetical protein